jgi:hypothetical protein
VIDIDTHDPAGMAAFLRERAKANREIAALPFDQWPRRPDVLRHWALRFDQAAKMIERLAERATDSASDSVRLHKALMASTHGPEIVEPTTANEDYGCTGCRSNPCICHEMGNPR